MQIKRRGFSLVELMVVVGIILILLSIVMASIVDARQDSRDKRRVSDLSNIALAMTLYKEKHREYPDYPDGVEIGKGGALDPEIVALNGNTYTDPRAEDGDDYSYWYFSNILCNGEQVSVVASQTMENAKNGNLEEFIEDCGITVGALTETGLIPEIFESTYDAFIPQTYAYSGNGGDRNSGQVLQYSQSSYYPVTCSATPNVVTLDQNGSFSQNVIVSWVGHDGESSVVLTGPNGFSVGTWDSTTSGVYLFQYGTASVTGLTAGMYSVSAAGCSASITVNPYIAPSQCNDGIDNADAEDTLTDSADPGCHTGDDLAQPYDSTINSEDNVVAPPPPPPPPVVITSAYIIVLK